MIKKALDIIGSAEDMYPYIKTLSYKIAFDNDSTNFHHLNVGYFQEAARKGSTKHCEGRFVSRFLQQVMLVFRHILGGMDELHISILELV